MTRTILIYLFLFAVYLVLAFFRGLSFEEVTDFLGIMLGALALLYFLAEVFGRVDNMHQQTQNRLAFLFHKLEQAGVIMHDKIDGVYFEEIDGDTDMDELLQKDNEQVRELKANS